MWQELYQSFSLHAVTVPGVRLNAHILRLCDMWYSALPSTVSTASLAYGKAAGLDGVKCNYRGVNCNYRGYTVTTGAKL